jgi:hypothetical protein
MDADFDRMMLGAGGRGPAARGDQGVPDKWVISSLEN